MALKIGLDDDPIHAMRRWYREAEEVLTSDEAHSMALATVDGGGAPSVRVVLCRRIADRGDLVFFTNYRSRKGRDLDAEGRAAVMFHWRRFGRQLRVEGVVTRCTDAASDAYWRGRPRPSQISAIASPQSDPVDSFAALETVQEELRQKYGEAEIPRPKWWGGYSLAPRAIEFWVEGQARLHERIRFSDSDTGWSARYIGP